MTSRVERARQAFGNYRLARRTARSLRALAETAATPEQAIDGAMSHWSHPTSIRAVQVKSELAAFVELVRADAPRTVLEIGTAEGGTLYMLAWASDAHARLLSLDIERFTRTRLHIYRGFVRRGQHVEVFRADSHTDATRARVMRYFGGRPLDLLFIDGDHSYGSVRDDYERYAPLVRSGGLIAFHDIVDGTAETSGDAPRFWREIRGELAAPREFVESWEQGGYGIGVGRRR